ncbi:MAG TPA: peptidoglycan DD-metalloendopeptidase family protein [Gemmatimonadales bacterium]|nr:peptidoglycan DD-metalloendopeptidase family protein [Gemmatimonadales bacterium]
MSRVVRWRLALVLLLLPAVLPSRLPAQSRPSADLDASRRRLEEIRAERSRLEQQQQRLRGQVHDVRDELTNLERQRESTNRIVEEIERQIGGLSSQLERSTAELILAQDNLAERRAVLERRLVDIYKRGPLYAFQVMLTSSSFGDLLSRYKYLYLTSRQDRALMGEVEGLRNRVQQQRNEILHVKNQLDHTREEREAELQRYSQLADQRSSRLADLQRSQQRTQARLAALQRDEGRLNGLLAALERARREEAARAARAAARANAARAATPGRSGAATPPAAPPAPAAGSITTADLGRLDWPVQGTIVYRFGRDTLPSGGVIRWNGIGIQAAVGTPVRSVEAGRVRLVGQFGTYGLTIVLEHGNGYYSVYSHLQDAAVKLGDAVTRGQTIATVGGENSDYGSHLHFEIRGENQQALDPAQWLRRR